MLETWRYVSYAKCSKFCLVLEKNYKISKQCHVDGKNDMLSACHKSEFRLVDQGNGSEIRQMAL